VPAEPKATIGALQPATNDKGVDRDLLSLLALRLCRHFNSICEMDHTILRMLRLLLVLAGPVLVLGDGKFSFFPKKFWLLLHLQQPLCLIRND